MVTEPDSVWRVMELIKNPDAIKHAGSPVVQQLLFNMLPRVTGLWPKPDGYKYMCMEHWVLEHGSFWDYEKLTKKRSKDYDLEMGAIKMCYSNSYNAACANPDEIVYVEGYASGVIVFNHAWNTISALKKPNLVDLTLREHFRDDLNIGPPTYFGVPFNLDYVAEVLEEKGCMGVIDNWKQNFPLLKNDDLLDKAIHPDWRR